MGALAVVLLLIGKASSAQADWMEDVGYDRLMSMVGKDMPNGNGVPISFVEAVSTKTNDNGTPEDTSDDYLEYRSYRPDPEAPFFTADTDPLSEAVVFTDGSNLTTCGQSGEACFGYSDHATYTVGSHSFGNGTSFAPGANAVTYYEANHYLNSILKAGSTAIPVAQPFRVQSFSWVGTYGNDSTDRRALRKFDYAIETNGITAFVGLNNNPGDVPTLMVQSYNAIGVGRSDGNHSSGLTDLVDYGVGRSKPDIVVPYGTTSAATAACASVATFLHSADGVTGTDAALPETMKAILMAGATKDESDFVTPWTRSYTQPLDTTYGAGEVNGYNSYLITQGGQYAASVGAPTPVGSYGWDYQTASAGAGNGLEYVFEVPEGSYAEELSIMLTWNVDVLAPFSSQSLANLDMVLQDSGGSMIDQSVSTVDNVEHIYLTDLDAGVYSLLVSSDADHDFGLAWRMTTKYGTSALPTPSADFDGDGDVDTVDLLTWQRGFGTILGAGHAEGDADGDGDVDDEDRLVLNEQFGSYTPVPGVAAMVIPEPSGLVLLAGLAAGALCFRGRRR